MPVVPIDGAVDTDAVLDREFADGNAVGKRYTDGDGLEVLVTKAGSGSLSVGAVLLRLKSAQPLPASD